MIDTTICLIVPARNCRNHFDSNLLHIRNVLEKLFKVVKIVVIESDSVDGTQEVGENAVERKLIDHFFSLGQLSNKYPERTQRIATARNYGLDFVLSRYAPEFLSFADIDGVNLSLTEEGIATCFKHQGWSGMVANQIGRYYDIWALRHPVWCGRDCWEDYRELLPILGHSNATWLAVGAKQIHIPKDTVPIAVDSAFGGFGIYHTEKCIGARWNGLSAKGTEVCEWVEFNRAVVGKVFINPAMVNTGAPEHYIDLPQPYLLESVMRIADRIDSMEEK